MSNFKFKVLTLNCWGVFTPLACKDRSKRIIEIAHHILNGEYDVIQFQEIWLQADYKLLENMVSHIYPYSVYFNSGIFGSGLCTFSKCPILNSSFRAYSLNGYASRFYHGDWYGSKGVSLCRILIGRHVVNFYNTHLHADYSGGITSNDDYLGHRSLQAFELSQFINLTKGDSKAIICSGDFNLTDNTLGYRLIKNATGLIDAWKILNPHRNSRDGSTCDRSSNVYTSASSLKDNPDGLRIDYIMYNGIADCETCNLCMTEVIGGLNMNFSDHEAICATFSLDSDKELETIEGWRIGYFESIMELRTLTKEGLNNTRFSYKKHLAMTMILFVFTCFSMIPCNAIIATLLTILFCYLSLYNIFIVQNELNGYILNLNILENLMKSPSPH